MKNNIKKISIDNASKLKKNLMFVIVFAVTEIRLLWNYLYGFRWPSDYVLANNVFTYDFGFIPRAFVASVMKLLFGDRIYSMKFLFVLIVGTSLLILVFFMYMSYYFNFKNRNLIGSVLILWYSLSIYSAYLPDEMGYFEQYAYVLLCMVILFPTRIKSSIRYSALCSAIGLVCLLISETTAFLVLPILFMMSLMRVMESPNSKRFLFLLIAYVPSVVYCLWAGTILIPESQRQKLLELIHSHVDAMQLPDSFFLHLDSVAGIFGTNKGRMGINVVGVLNFQVWPWQLKFYLILVILMTTLMLLLLEQKRRAYIYTVEVLAILLCVYCVNFIAWDFDRFKFCAAMAVTFFSLWIIKETDMKKFKISREMQYVLLLGTIGMIMIMDYRLWLFWDRPYNYSLTQLINTLRDTWRINY